MLDERHRELCKQVMAAGDIDKGFSIKINCYAARIGFTYEKS